MERKKTSEKAAGCGVNNQDELLDIDELLDVQGGVEEEPVNKCGLGCYLSGISNTGHDETTPKENDKP